MLKKWHWWIPLIGIFFIEEMVGWIFDSPQETADNRRILFQINMLYHCLCALLLSVISTA